MSESTYPELLDLLRKQSLKDTDVATMTDTLQNEINNRVSDLLSEQAKRDLLQATMTYYYLYELKIILLFKIGRIMGILIYGI